MNVADAERLALYESGYSDKEIAQRTGYQRETITDWRGRHHLTCRRGWEQRRREWAERLRLWEAGLSDLQIARMTGRTKQAIGAWRRKEGLEANNG